MKGEFNFTFKKLIELSLAIGKAPVIVFKPLIEITQTESEKISSQKIPTLTQVAEPVENYKITGK
jgi:hypothetical protein